MEPERLLRAGRVAAWCVIGAMTLLLPLAVWAVLRVDTSSANVQPWFPEDTVERENYRTFDRIFGPEDYWILSPRESTDLEVLRRLEREVRKAADAAEPPLVRRIQSSASMLEELPPNLRPEARKSLEGIFFSLEGDRGIVFVESNEAGFRARQQVYGEIIQPVLLAMGPDEPIAITGPGYMGVMADRETSKAFTRVTPLTFLISATIALLVLRSIPVAVVALSASGLSALFSIALIHWTGGDLSHLNSVVPSVAQLLGMSNAVHFLGYYQSALRQRERESAWIGAWRNGWKPTVAASVTTIIGFLSLGVSGLPVVRGFSAYGALGVVAAMVVVLTVVPACLILIRPSRFGRDWIRDHLIPLAEYATLRRPFITSGLLLAAMAFACWGFPHLETDTRTENFFSERSEMKRSLNWFEEEFGYLQAAQIVGRFDLGEPLLSQWKSVDALRRDLAESNPELTVFTPPGLDLIASLGDEARLKRSVEAAQIFREFEGVPHWRITVYHEPVIDFLQSDINRGMVAAVERAGGNWFVSGTYRLFGEAQQLLMRELMKTFLLAFLLITPCTIFFLRNVRLGLLAIVGSLFPIIVFFGMLGILEIRIDIATMVIASVAFGIAVDDTIHFLTSLERGERRNRRGEIRDILDYAFRQSGAAIIKTSLIIALGMLAFLISDFGPSRRFAVFTSIVLLLAVVGDLILLPALIAGPLRKFFGSRRLTRWTYLEE